MLRIISIAILTIALLQDEKEPVTFHLPFKNGKTFKVWQGNDQGPSHNDDFNRYAWDFSMRVGTPVHAAAGGVVTAVKEDTEGPTGNGGDNNYVKIRHADGSEAQYHHLKKDGAVVKKGQIVLAGDLIAYSGNTGASDAPHLHFGVHKGGKSISVKFEDVPDDGGNERVI